MPDFSYFRHHLYGAWRLLRGDQAGFDHFDISEAGFWRSFWAVGVAFVFMIPIFIAGHKFGVTYAEQVEDYVFAVPLGVYLIAKMLTGVIGLAIFLVLMVPVSRTFGVGARYGIFVVAYNWASLLIVLLTLPLSLIGIFGWLAWDVVSPFQLVLGLIFLVYGWFIASVALKLPPLDAAAVVALETLVVLILSHPAAALYGLFPG